MINCVSEKPADYTVVFTGVVGAGTSTAGNFFLNGEYFECHDGFISITKQCSSATSTVCGKTVKIIDTPGFDPYRTNEGTLQELNRSLALAKDGIHAVAFVMSTGFNKLYEKVFTHVQLLHLKSFLFILFTHAKGVGVTKAEADEYIQQVLRNPKCPQGLRNILRLVENRVIMVESFNTTKEYCVQKSKEFMAMIKHIHQSNGYKVCNDVLILKKDGEERKGKNYLVFCHLIVF